MPFISAGGTSLSVFMGAIGILCNVGKSKESSEEFKKSKFELGLFKDKKKKELELLKLKIQILGGK